MQELKIDPEFQGIIPPLTDDEFKQLRNNILEVGEVFDPICVWKGVIVDGHNRWKIIQENPDIQYRVHEMIFMDRSEAIEWMYQNQLGRRNLSDENRSYIRGKLYEVQKRSQGGTGANQHTVEQSGHNVQSAHSRKRTTGDKTAERIGEKYGVNARTIRRDADYAAAVDRADSIVPGFKDSILSGSIKISKKFLKDVCTLQDGLMQEALQAIRNGDIQDAENLIQAGKSIQKRNSTPKIEDIQDVEFEPVITGNENHLVLEQVMRLHNLLEESSAVLEYFVNETGVCQKMPADGKAAIIEIVEKMSLQIETIRQNLQEVLQ